MPPTWWSILSWSPSGSCGSHACSGARTSLPGRTAALRKVRSIAESTLRSCGPSSRHWSRGRGSPARSCGASAPECSQSLRHDRPAAALMGADAATIILRQSWGGSFMSNRALFAAVAAFLASLPGQAAAQQYPSKSVRMIVPFGAGGPADVFGRVIAQHLSEQLKQSFVIENRPGAGAIIGTDAVAKAAPDGYTLLVMSNTHTTNESLIPNRPYQLMRDFAALAPINSSDLLMVAHPSVGAKTLKEFIAVAKAKPGQLNYASS